MTFTEIYKVKDNGDVVFYDEVFMSAAGCYYIWASIGEKYGVPFSFYDNNVNGELWKLADSGKLTDATNLVLKSTYDYAVVRKELLPELIMAYKKFERVYSGGNVAEQIVIMERLLNEVDCQGICWNQTSVNVGLWSEGTKDGETIPYNVNTGKKHFIVENKKNIENEEVRNDGINS